MVARHFQWRESAPKKEIRAVGTVETPNPSVAALFRLRAIPITCTSPICRQTAADGPMATAEAHAYLPVMKKGKGVVGNTL